VTRRLKLTAKGEKGDGTQKMGDGKGNVEGASKVCPKKHLCLNEKESVIPESSRRFRDGDGEGRET
jgi:hypothetical protein